MKKKILSAAACIAAVYGMVYADALLRARSAYLEGRKYLLWRQTPSLKAAALDEELSQKKARLKASFSAGRLDASELDQRMLLARFARDEALNESSVKYAYAWFQTSAELFRAPPNRWSSLSAEKMEEAKKLWRLELQSSKVPFQEYMLE